MIDLQVRNEDVRIRSKEVGVDLGGKFQKARKYFYVAFEVNNAKFLLRKFE